MIRRLGPCPIALLCAAMALLMVPDASFALTLADKGVTTAKIYVKTGATPEVQEAAGKLSEVLKKMSGAEIPVAPIAGAGQIDKSAPAIVLGDLAAEMGLKMEKTSRAKDGFRYKVVGKQLLIVGESGQGVFNGVFAFLESLGCGWYVPGPMGEVVPQRLTIDVADDLDHSEVSDSIYRRFWYGGGGSRADSEVWKRINKGELNYGSWRHAYNSLVSKEELAAHPEYGSMVRGQRTTKQLCTTNPQVIKLGAESLMRHMANSNLVVFPAGPNDGGGLCECPECAKLNTPGYVEPSSGKTAVSDQIFQFANDLAAITSKKFPDKDLGILVYSDYSVVPKKITQLSPNVFPMIAPIRRCRLHGPGTDNCPLSQLLEQEIEGWGKISNNKLGFYFYNYNLADAMLPLSKISFYKHAVDAAHKVNVQQLAWDFETIDAWAIYAPHNYLSVRLAWNSHIDIDKEMDRFFSGFYGEAAEPMKHYWMTMDHAYVTTPAHTGAQFSMRQVWTDPLLQSSRADIAKAQQLAKNDRVKQAVAMADAGLKCAEYFTRIWDSLGQCDFASAAKTQAQLQAHITSMVEHTSPNWARERYTWGYFAGGIGKVVDAGAAIVNNGGKVLVKLPDVWKFQKDEKLAGFSEGWFKPEYSDAKWGTLATFSKSWDDQGLGLYDGEGWYRTTFDLSPSPGTPGEGRGEGSPLAAKDIRLWFGGFDFNVDVYLNGQSLGEKRGFLKPQEYANVAQYLKPGKNVIAVRVAAGGLAEIGTGGLMMPVMLYDASALKLPDPPAQPTGKAAGKKAGQGNQKKGAKGATKSPAPATRPAGGGGQYDM